MTTTPEVDTTEIEEVVEKLALELEDDFLEYDCFVQDEQPTGKKGVDDENQKRLIIRKILLSQQQKHREELQKARQTWLQEEIVKLEGMKVRNGTLQKWYGIEQPITEDEASGFNQALQTIIDRYQAELNQDNK